ncbi:hypothetical protein CROQUDRAFT_27253, partial [Cronartium quercuum f. sp. fusiforme G11]
QQYQMMLEQVDAHSDDEYSPKHDTYIVKTLAYHSFKAGQFIRCVDDHMHKSAQLTGKQVQGRRHLQPKKLRPSIMTKPPKGLPLDFYNVEWFNETLSTSQKGEIGNIHQVMFLEDALQSLLGKSHPDEKLSNKKFNEKYWAKSTKEYIMEHMVEEEEDEEDDEDNPDANDEGESIDLEETDEEEDGEDGDY